MSISPGNLLPGLNMPWAIDCSSSSAIRRHNDTPDTSASSADRSVLRDARCVMATSQRLHPTALPKLSSNIDNSVMANPATQISPAEAEMRSRRREAMALLAACSVAEIVNYLDAIGPLPPHADLRPGENGMVMVRGRIGGDGAPFNFGGATGSRAAVRLSTGEIGYGYRLVRHRTHARPIAMYYALGQREQHYP